jgi:hypothetical protein
MEALHLSARAAGQRTARVYNQSTRKAVWVTTAIVAVFADKDAAPCGANIALLRGSNGPGLIMRQAIVGGGSRHVVDRWPPWRVR